MSDKNCTTSRVDIRYSCASDLAVTLKPPVNHMLKFFNGYLNFLLHVLAADIYIPCYISLNFKIRRTADVSVVPRTPQGRVKVFFIMLLVLLHRRIARSRFSNIPRTRNKIINE